MSLLSVRDLTVKFAMRDNTVTALNQISFDLAKGERLGIVGNPAPVNPSPDFH